MNPVTRLLLAAYWLNWPCTALDLSCAWHNAKLLGDATAWQAARMLWGRISGSRLAKSWWRTTQ